MCSCRAGGHPPRAGTSRADMLWELKDGPADATAWLEAAYSDRSLVTQVGTSHADQAAAGDHPAGNPTSSSTLPGLIVRLAQLAYLADGADVLDVGTGSGYGCALLAARLGTQHVTSVDVDPHLTAAAAERLDSVGLRPAVLTADATGALPGTYDRIIATFAVRPVPASWLAALRPGGRLVTTIAGTGLILTADKTDDGGAMGRIEWDRAGFMVSRHGPGYPPPLWDRSEAARDQAGEEVSQGRYAVVNVMEAWELWSMLTVLAPGVEHYYQEAADRRTAWMLHPDGSWARASEVGSESPVVHQGGARRLWDLLDEIRDDVAAGGVAARLRSQCHPHAGRRDTPAPGVVAGQPECSARSLIGSPMTVGPVRPAELLEAPSMAAADVTQQQESARWTATFERCHRPGGQGLQACRDPARHERRYSPWHPIRGHEVVAREFPVLHNDCPDVIRGEDTAVVHHDEALGAFRPRRHPVQRKHPSHGAVQPKLLSDLPPASRLWRLLGLYRATWQVPGIPVDRIDEEHSPRLVAAQGACCHALTRQRCHVCIRWHDTGLTGNHLRHSSRTIVASRPGTPSSAPPSAGHDEGAFVPNVDAYRHVEPERVEGELQQHRRARQQPVQRIGAPFANSRVLRVRRHLSGRAVAV